MFNRRQVLASVGGAMLATGGLYALPGHELPPVSPAPLKSHAARRGLNFGAMIRATHVQNRALMRVLTQEADMTVPEVELKWGMVEQIRGRPDYRPADAIAAFARKEGMRMRGHTAFWYRNIPRWADEAMKGPEWRSVMLNRVSSTVARFRGQIAEWDVVNEAIDATDTAFFPRKAPFGRDVDFGYIADCFAAAHDADPTAGLFYNDYGMEYDTRQEDYRRAALLALIDEMRRRNAPIHGVGLQSHLGVHRRFNAAKYRAFLKDIADRGVIIRLTEFDVVDRYATRPLGIRDEAVADHARRFLDTAFDEPQVKGLICWGMRDTDSWIMTDASTHGVMERPLPWDNDCKRKPLWTAIAAAFDAAPMRTAG